jgi:hypothetical protein
MLLLSGLEIPRNPLNSKPRDYDASSGSYLSAELKCVKVDATVSTIS